MHVSWSQSTSPPMHVQLHCRPAGMLGPLAMKSLQPSGTVVPVGRIQVLPPPVLSQMVFEQSSPVVLQIQVLQ